MDQDLLYIIMRDIILRGTVFEYCPNSFTLSIIFSFLLLNYVKSIEKDIIRF